MLWRLSCILKSMYFLSNELLHHMGVIQDNHILGYIGYWYEVLILSYHYCQQIISYIYHSPALIDITDYVAFKGRLKRIFLIQFMVSHWLPSSDLWMLVAFDWICCYWINVVTRPCALCIRFTIHELLFLIILSLVQFFRVLTRLYRC